MAKLPTGLRKRGPAIEIRVMVGGKTYTENLKGDFSKDHIAACVKRREHIKSQLTHGDFGLAFAKFEDVAQDWINVLDVKRSTSMSYAALLNKYWLPAFEGKSVASIASADIKRVLAGYEVSNKTKKNALAVLSSIFNHAEINPNPCRAVKIRRNQKAPIQRYTPSERITLLDTLRDSNPSSCIQCGFMCIFYAGYSSIIPA